VHVNITILFYVRANTSPEQKNMFLASTLPYTFLLILCDIAPAITQREKKSLVNDTWIDPLQRKKINNNDNLPLDRTTI